jgi:hypothetical protein
MANLGMIRSSLKLLNKTIKENPANPLSYIFCFLFQLMLREENNCDMQLTSDVEDGTLSNNYQMRQQELKIQSQFIVLDKKSKKLRFFLILDFSNEEIAVQHTRINAKSLYTSKSKTNSINRETQDKQLNFEDEKVKRLETKENGIFPKAHSLIDYLETAFKNFFKLYKITKEKLVPLQNSEISKESLDYFDKNKNPNTSSFKESILKHKISFKKPPFIKELEYSNFLPFSTLLNSKNIPESITSEYERLLVLCTQTCILFKNYDILSYILNFYDCFLFREADFRVAWAFYALLMREFESARLSFESALKREPDHWLALLGFGIIYLAGMV